MYLYLCICIYICICENSRYLKTIVDASVIVCDEIINVTDKVSTNVANAISTKVRGTVSINSNDKKVTREKIISSFIIFHY